MVIDTSALVAVLMGEPEQADVIRAIEHADICLLSAASWVEASIVIESRYGVAGLYHLDRFLARAGAETVAVGTAQARIAREAFQRYGKGAPFCSSEFRRLLYICAVSKRLFSRRLALSRGPPAIVDDKRCFAERARYLLWPGNWVHLEWARSRRSAAALGAGDNAPTARPGVRGSGAAPASVCDPEPRTLPGSLFLARAVSLRLLRHWTRLSIRSGRRLW